MQVSRLMFGALLVLLCAAAPAWAGRSCEQKAPGPVEIQKALELAHSTRDALEAGGARVALVARVGRDLSRHGLRYSHVAFALRDHPKGRWLLTHLLNHCGTAGSSLYDEGLGNFFMDDVHEHEALIVVPSPALQQRLAAVLRSTLPRDLHTPSYSLIAHPFSSRHQNSNQWLLEVLAAAVAPAGTVTGRVSAQRWLADSGYTAAEIRISPAQRIGARLFAANVRFDDRSDDELLNGTYRVVSVESVVAFLVSADASAQRLVVTLR